MIGIFGVHFGIKPMQKNKTINFLNLGRSFILILTFIVSGCESSGSPWKTFHSPLIGGFQIKYPSTWSADAFSNGYHNDQQAIAVFHAQTLFAFPSMILAQKQMELPRLENVVEWGGERFLEFNDSSGKRYRWLDLEYKEVNGQLVATRDYEMVAESPLPLKKRDVYLINGDVGYIMTFTAEAEQFDEQVQLFEEMVTSFKFLEES
jgi:hypothetical protein